MDEKYLELQGMVRLGVDDEKSYVKLFESVEPKIEWFDARKPVASTMMESGNPGVHSAKRRPTAGSKAEAKSKGKAKTKARA